MTKDELEVRILNIERRILALEMRLDATGVAHVLAPVCSGDHYWYDMAPCAGKAKGHDWELIDERAPHMGWRCTRCGMEAA